MIRINSVISIDPKEIQLQFIRSSGPGGQNVNKVSTAVLLRYDVRGSATLPDDVKTRLFRLAGKSITANGILSIKAQSFRTQERNREAALTRLVRLIQKAAEKPRVRLKTKPSPARKENRLEGKHQRSRLKQMRGRIDDDV